MTQHNALRLILFGPPGAGKGTQAQRLAARTGATHLSSGDLVRAAIASHSPVGDMIRSYNDRGLLVPDEVIVEVITDHLSKLRSWILDGFPRTLPQALALDEFLTEHHETIDRVIDLDVPDHLLVARLSGRRQSESTGRIYHLIYDPPPPDDPGPFLQRQDDRPDVIVRRLQEYHAKTEPLVRYYAERGLLLRIDASGTPDAVTDAILKALSPFEGEGAPAADVREPLTWQSSARPRRSA